MVAKDCIAIFPENGSAVAMVRRLPIFMGDDMGSATTDEKRIETERSILKRLE